MKSITDLNVKNYINDLEKNVTELKFKLENSENLINQQDQKILELVKKNEENNIEIKNLKSDLVKVDLNFKDFFEKNEENNIKLAKSFLEIKELQKTLDYQNNSLEESRNLFKKTKHEYNQISWFFLTITILSFIFAICDYLKLF